MLTEQIKAYPFWEYGDDPNIRLFFEMFNAASQDYLDWANDTTLAYYPALSGSLLQWVAAGLYGEPYYSAVESPLTGAIGSLNTVALNTIPLNYFAAATATVYAITDDIFKRIITWNFYKGDGRRFSIPWLKRRIMRFLVGADGIDPQPWNGGFIVGAENTSTISVEFSGQNCVITINQLALSAMLQLTPNILPIFAAAFVAPGVLEKPIEWNYSVTIEVGISAILSPSPISVTGATASETTGNVTVSVLGGSGSYTYAWTFISGGSGITIGSPSAHITDFSASTLIPGQTLSGIAQCVVTDTVTHDTTSVAVQVSLIRVALPTCSASPASINVSGSTDTVTSPQVTVTGVGAGPFSAVWTWQSGGTNIGINSPNTLSTSFTGVDLEYGDSESGVALCTLTDSYGQHTSCTVPVEFSRATEVTASITPSSLSATGASESETTATATVTASGGVAPYNYSVAWQSGGTGINIDSPTSATSAFTAPSLAPGASYSGVAVWTVTDSIGQMTQVTCAVAINRVTSISASVSPSSQSSSGDTATQTTGLSTVSASGGSDSYSYAWTFVSGGANLVANSPSSAATSWTGSGMTPGNTYSGVARCIVTDGYSQTTSVTVSVSITRTGNVYSGNLTAGEAGTPPNIITGYDAGSFGSLSPTVDANGNTITAIYSAAGLGLMVQITSVSELGADYFTSIQSNSFSFPVSAAEYHYSGGVNSWGWPEGYTLEYAYDEIYSVVLTS